MSFRVSGALWLGMAILAPVGMPLLAQSGAQHGNARQAPSAPRGAVIPMPPDRAVDSYAIYSMLMPGDQFAGLPADQAARWAICDVTVNEDDRNPAVPPQGQLKPPSENPKGFEEAVHDYEANKYVRVQLAKGAFHIEHAFTLLGSSEAADLRGAKSGPGVGSGEQARWAGYPGITYFSEVYFDAKHTAALVYMNDWCAHLCSSGSWIYLEKHGGRWVRRSGIVTGGA